MSLFFYFCFFLLFFRPPVPQYFSSLLGWAVYFASFTLYLPGSPIGLLASFSFLSSIKKLSLSYHLPPLCPESSALRFFSVNVLRSFHSLITYHLCVLKVPLSANVLLSSLSPTRLSRVCLLVLSFPLVRLSVHCLPFGFCK